MLITVDKSVVEAASDGDAVSILAIENVLAGHFEGNHIVHFESPKTLRKLLGCQLSCRAEATVKYLLSSTAFSFSLFDVLDSLVRLTAIDKALSYSQHAGWVIPVEMFTMSSLSQPTVLIGENLNDCELFIHAANHAKIYLGLGSLRLASDKVNGGGDTTHESLSKELNTKGKFALCITDSDKKSPGYRLGTTAKKCSKVKGSEAWVVFHETIEAHEAENVVAVTILKNSLPDKNDLISKYDSILGSEIRKYVDLKKGTYLSAAFLHGSSEGYKQFLKQSAACHGNMRDCIADDECRNEEKCSCVFSEPLGDYVLSSILTYLHSITPHKSYENIGDDYTDDWQSIGNLVLAWCCSSNPIQS